MLRILKADEPLLIDFINLCLYSPPGIGKTTLSFTADDPLLLDFDNGSYRAANRKDVVRVSAWSQVAEITAEDLKPYKTVIVDTAGRALDYLTADIIAENPKMGRGGALTLQGYGALKARFTGWLKMLKTFGKDAVLLAHMDEQRNGDDVIERLDVQGGSKGEIYKSVDAMGRLFIRDKKRVLDFSPRENAFGKNPANLQVLDIPEITANPRFLAEVIASIKSQLNAQSEEQKAANTEMEQFSEAIGKIQAAADFNLMLPEVKKKSKVLQGIFSKRTKDLGLTFNKEAKLYEDPPPVAVPAGAELFGK